MRIYQCDLCNKRLETDKEFRMNMMSMGFDNPVSLGLDICNNCHQIFRENTKKIENKAWDEAKFKIKQQTLEFIEVFKKERAEIPMETPSDYDVKSANPFRKEWNDSKN